MEKSQLDVVVDNREKRSSYGVAFRAHDDVNKVSEAQLDVGDFVITDSEEDHDPVVFERKTPQDFVESIKNDRLENQMQAMYDRYGEENAYLLVEGNRDDFDVMQYSNFSTTAVHGFIGSLAARWQRVPLFCSGSWGVVDMATRISRKRFESTGRFVFNPSMSVEKNDISYLERAVLQLDGIGPKTAEKIVEKYDSMSYFTSTATVDNLTEIEGIGEKTAESIRSQLYEGEQNGD